MARTMKRSRETDRRRARLVDVCRSLPEVDVSGEQHLAFKIGKKTFAHYLYDHHGDGRVALCGKAAPLGWSKAPGMTVMAPTPRRPQR